MQLTTKGQFKMTQYTDLMIDIETLDTRPTAKIIQIGAVVFNAAEQGIDGVRFIGNTVCLDRRYTESEATIEWWDKQSKEAKRGLRFPPVEPIHDVLQELAQVIEFEFADRDFRVWAKGADFDFPILKNAFETEFGAGLEMPWKYNRQNCCRTVFKLFPEIKLVEPKVAHNAMRDAVAQAETIQNIYAHIAKLRGAA